MNDKLAFSPVLGEESQILSCNPLAGHVWFATDTKKIFYSNGSTFLPMGGNSSVFYGIKNIPDDTDPAQKEFEFTPSEIDGNQGLDGENYKIPNVDDLILNKDGCFYRVTNIETIDENTTIHALKLTLQGTGGGGGGGNNTNVGTLTFKDITPRTSYCLHGSPFVLEFTVNAVDAENIPTGNGSYSIEINGVKDRVKGVCFQGTNSVEIGSYLRQGENKVRVYVTMDIGGSGFVTQSKLWSITASEVTLTWNYDETTINNLNEDFSFGWTVSGYQITKTTYIIIDDIIHLPGIISSSTTKQIHTITPGAEGINLSHGAHKVEIYAVADIGGVLISTPSIVKNIIFEDTALENAPPIISCGFFGGQVMQYNTVKIPIIFYAKDNINNTLSAELRENGIKVDTWENLENRKVYTWNYTPTTPGRHVLSIICGSAEKTLVANVQAININNEEVPGYAFRFKSSEFTSNNAVQHWTSNGVTAEFSDNFDWINGGLKSELDDSGNHRQYFCVKSGTTMTINYDLLAQQAHMLGKMFKFIFKATNCKDYSAQVLSSGIGSNNKNIYLKLAAQNATFQGSATKINVPYCEDSYIEFSLDITKKDAENPEKRYITAWLDGVPTVFKQYDSSEDFNVNDSKIIIGSPDCDVWIYLVKVYENALTGEEHLANFIADAPNAQEMIARYDRNDIIDPYTRTISPTLLAAKNPNCRVHVYDIPRMTLNKDDKVSGCSYVQYHGSETPVLSAEDVTIKVQGTSSATYGLSAFNLDSKFEKGFVHADGHTTKGWSMNEGSIPVNYFCTKVNVASAEHTNNAINQEWYNRYQPYQSDWKKNTPGARDTMEFVPGVLFIQDHNTQKIFDPEQSDKFISNNLFAEIDGYVGTTPETTGPYARMYSICNMGNSKKNVEVLHNTKNRFEYCIENSDNQKALQWMTQCDYNDDIWDQKPKTWEFRYPDGHDKLDNTIAEFDDPLGGSEKITHRQHAFNAWRRLVKWMAESNPQPRFKEENITSQADLDEYNSKYSKVNSELQKKKEGLLQQINSLKTEIDLLEKQTNLTEDQQKDLEAKKKALNTAQEELDNVNIQLAANSSLYSASHDGVNLTEIPKLADSIYDAGLKYFSETVHKYGYTMAPLNSPYTSELYAFKDPISTKLYGSTVLKYSGKTFNYDTYEYRMAKMLSECEEYLVMDSIIFHYLFIERHTMIDNVAKNTFWSTEDGLRWNLVKDYDNDTSDGNDNQGGLTLTYGIEPTDEVPSADATATKFYFNAHQSVWFQFCHGLYEACKTLYNKLESTGVQGAENAWDPTSYLQACSDWQKTIPERCWIEDYYRKYFRPLELYGDSMFMNMLEGGQKTHQRKQFETYQNYYISSKYLGKTATNNKIIIRGNGQLFKNGLPVTTYADCYIQAAFGTGTDAGVSMRVKRNEPATIHVPDNIESMNNATIYFYLPQLYQTIGGTENNSLNILQPEQMTMSPAIKLRTLIAGEYGEKDIHGNPLKNNLLYHASFKNNTLLETLHFCNYTPTNKTGTTADGEVPTLGSLNLSAAINLKDLDTRDSHFTSVEIADGAPLKTLRLQDPGTLSLKNLNYLETFNIVDIDKLNYLIIDNIDNSQINSKIDIIDKIQRSLNYSLKNVQWAIDQAEDLDQSNPEDISVKVLETILKQYNPYDPVKGTSTHAESLTGIMNINIELSANDAQNLYKKYTTINAALSEEDKSKRFIGLNMNFTNIIGEEKLYSVKIENGDGSTVWSGKLVSDAAGKAKLTDSELSYSPQGPFSANKIYKASSELEDYSFNDSWRVEAANNPGVVIYTINSQQPLWDNITSDIIIKPNFTATTRTWSVEIYIDDKKIEGLKACEAGITLQQYFDAEQNNITPLLYKDDSKLAFDQTYIFNGYSTTKDGTDPIKLSDYRVTGKVVLYALFKEINVYDNIHEDWFLYNGSTYYEIRPKENAPLKGKITLPARHNGIPVTTIKISAFEGNTDITHVFVGRDNGVPLLSNIQSLAFSACSNLQYFDFPSSLKLIQYGAFRYTSLKPQNQRYFFGDNVEKIASRAFHQALNFEEDVTICLPGSLFAIDSAAFQWPNHSRGHKINIEIGTKGNPSKLDFEQAYTLGNTSTNTYSIFIVNYPDKTINTLTFYSNNPAYTNFDVAVTRNGITHTIRDWLTNGKISGATWTLNNGSNIDEEE